MSEAKDWAGELISGQTGTGRILVSCYLCSQDIYVEISTGRILEVDFSYRQDICKWRSVQAGYWQVELWTGRILASGVMDRQDIGKWSYGQAGYWQVELWTGRILASGDLDGQDIGQ
jgi:hypothetical protein